MAQRTEPARVQPLAVVAAPDSEYGWIGPRIDTGAAPLHVGRALHQQIVRCFRGEGGVFEPETAPGYYTEDHPLGFGNIATNGAPLSHNYCYCHDGGEEDGPALVTRDTACGLVDWAYLITDQGLAVMRVHPSGISDPQLVPWDQADDPVFWQVLTGGLDDWRPPAGQAPRTGADL